MGVFFLWSSRNAWL